MSRYLSNLQNTYEPGQHLLFLGLRKAVPSGLGRDPRVLSFWVPLQAVMLGSSSVFALGITADLCLAGWVDFVPWVVTVLSLLSVVVTGRGVPAGERGVPACALPWEAL